jgi:hypothetical protein
MTGILEGIFAQSLKELFIHYILPIGLFLFAFGTLIFAPMRLRWKLVIAAILTIVGAVLLEWLVIPGVSV